METLEPKPTIAEIKKSLHGLNSRMEMTGKELMNLKTDKEKISEEQGEKD